MQLLRLTREQLHGRIYIEWIGEKAIDVGGPTKEFFSAGAEALFSPDYSMWRRPNDDKIWFRDSTFDSLDDYRSLGVFIAWAMFHEMYLPIRLPRVLCKNLIGAPLVLSDIAEIDHEVSERLKRDGEMRDAGDDIACCYLTFSVLVSEFGASKTVPFFPGGDDTDVTNENLDRYVHHYVQ